MIYDGTQWVREIPEALQVFKSHPNARIDPPQYGDAGIDLRCVENITIPPFRTGEKHVEWTADGIKVIDGNNLPEWIVPVHTGIHMTIPNGWYGRVAPRSSVGAGKRKKGQIPDPFGGIVLVADTIDSTYRGEIIVALANLTARPQTFEMGSKVAQLILTRCAHISEFNFVDSIEKLGETERGQGGFGSTGSK